MKDPYLQHDCENKTLDWWFLIQKAHWGYLEVFSKHTCQGRTVDLLRQNIQEGVQGMYILKRSPRGSNVPMQLKTTLKPQIVVPILDGVCSAPIKRHDVDRITPIVPLPIRRMTLFTCTRKATKWAVDWDGFSTSPLRNGIRSEECLPRFQLLFLKLQFVTSRFSG